MITGLTPVAGVTSVLLNWDDVPDLDFAYFQVELKDTLDGTFKFAGKVSDKRGLNVTGLKPVTDYWFRVVAYDKLGNRGTPSAEVFSKTLDDTIVPQVTGISPAPGLFANQIQLRGTATDNIGVSSFTFQYSSDRQAGQNSTLITFSNSSSPASASYAWDVSTLAEGAYYVRGVAKDAAGNSSNTSSDANYVEYRIDHTGPTAPTGLAAQVGDGYITLSWLQNPEQDLVAYKVYKSTSADGVFTVLSGRNSSLQYRDRDVEPLTVYYYRVAALDVAGNEGPFAPITAETLADITAPEVLSLSPRENAILPANPVLSVLTGDNFRLAKITLKYQLAGDVKSQYYLR